MTDIAEDGDALVDLTEIDNPSGAGVDGYDIDAVLGDDSELQALELQAERSRALVAERSVALSRAKNELHRLESAISQRTKSLVEAAERKVDWVGRRFPWDDKLAHELRATFKISSFRPLQREAVNAYLSKRDVFAVLPTGAGKSLIYQISAVVAGGITVVVSPLVALMHDQTAQLRKLGVKAYCLDSNTAKGEVAEIFSTALPPASKKRSCGTCVLFVTPERCAKSKKLLSRLQIAYDDTPRGLSHFVIDEAHCMFVYAVSQPDFLLASQMGHDFRNDYLQLGALRRMMKGVPVLCLTATATDKVVSDVCESLNIQPVILRGCIDRPNLFYEVRRKGTDTDVLSSIAELILCDFKSETGIIYVLSRKDSEELATALFTDYGIHAGCYHGDLSALERHTTYTNWISGRLQVICATISFGLGIDKQNCRFILHKELATSLEGYYQESGRAGRDGQPARCILFYRPMDVLRLASFVAGKGADRVPSVLACARYAAGHSDLVAARTSTGASASSSRKRPRESEPLSCRRAILAAAFGESPPRRVDDLSGELSGAEISELQAQNLRLASQCCDLCANAGAAERGRVRLEVTKEALAMALSLRSYHRSHPDEHITANALCDAMGNTGRKGREVRGQDVAAFPRTFDKDTRMNVLVAGVLEDVLSLYHTYGMYSMQGYLRCGNKVRSLEDGRLRVFVDIEKTHPLAVSDNGGRRKQAGQD